MHTWRICTFFTSYLSAKPVPNCLKAAALEFNCQIVHFMIVLPKKILVKLALSTFSTVLELLQTVYREKTEWWQIIVFLIDEKLSRALDRKSVITVPQQYKNFLVAGAKMLRATFMDA